MKIFLLIIFTCIAQFFSIAQNKTPYNQVNRADSLNLNQKAFSLVGLDFNRTLNNEILEKFKQLKIPGNFIEILLDSTIIKPNLTESYFSEKEKIKENEFVQLLNQNKIGQQILANWFNFQPDSSFNFEVLKKKGIIKYDEEDFIKASESRKGRIRLMEMGLKLVNQSYLLIFDFENTQTMEEYYREVGTNSDEQILNGYISTVNCNLLKLDFNSSVASVFFQDYWTTTNDTNKKEKTERFDNASFPFVLLKTYSYRISSTQQNPEQPLAPQKQKTKYELLQSLADLSLEKVINDISTQEEPFKLRSVVREIEPISAKIGRKGGLKFDQRYFVYENRIRKNGEIFQKRVGVVKSNRIIDNRKDSVPQTVNSAFYQIAGGPIYNGMYLKKRDDLGLNLFFGKSISGLPGYNARIEYYFSKIFDNMISPGKTAKGSTSFKVYFSSGFNNKDYVINEGNNKHTFVRGSLGVSKDFYPLRILHWSPYLGYGLESIKREGSANIVSSNFAEMGVRLGINITYNVQLIASYNLYKFFKSIELNENKDVVNPDFNYKQKYYDRSTKGISLGIRLML